MPITIDKVSKALALAENAGTPGERDAAMEMVQKLATAAGIDLAVARAHAADKTKQEEVERRTVRVNPSTRRSNRAHFVDLYLAIAAANNVKSLIGSGNVYVFPHGFPSDLNLVEALYNVLAVQMVSEADAALKRGEHKTREIAPKRRRVPITPAGLSDWIAELSDERYEAWEEGRLENPTTMLEDVLDDDGNQVMEERATSETDGRVWRANFYEGFVRRTKGRLWAAKQQAERDAGVEDDNEKGVALRDKGRRGRRLLRRGAEDAQPAPAGQLPRRRGEPACLVRP